MGARLGGTTRLFPSDERARSFLRAERCGEDFVEILADLDATYDLTDESDLSTMEPLIALPSPPGNVIPVRDVAGRDVEQVVLGSTANPGSREFAVVAGSWPIGRHTGGCPSTSTRPRVKSCRISPR